MNINKILHRVIIVGLCLVPFVPLIVNTSGFFPFITGKNFTFRIVVELIFASWLILALQDKSYRPKKSLLLCSVITLVIVTGLATVFSENYYRSFWSDYERMMGFSNILHLVAYFFVLISFLRKLSDWRYLAFLSIAANWLVNIYALLQLFGKLDVHQSTARLDATLGNAAYLAVYLLFNIFISAYLFYRSKINWAKVIYTLTVIADSFLLYHTATRGTILGLIGGVFVASGLFFMTGEKKQKKIAGVILGIVVLLIGGFLVIKNTDFVKNSPVLERFASISLTETTTQSRFLIWNMSWQGFKEHPVLGWGPENYSIVFSKYYDPAMWRQEPWFDRSHNVFFDWLIDAGLLGLFAYLSIFIFAIYYLWREKSKFGQTGSYLLIGLLSGYFFHNIFVFDNLISYIYFFSLIAFIHFVVTEESREKELNVKKDYQNKNNSHKEIDLSANVGVIIIVIVTVVSLYYVNYKPYMASLNLIKAINPYTTNAEQSVKIFQQVFALNTFGSGEAREQLISKTINVLNDPKVSNELKGEYVKLTDEQIKIHLQTYGEDARSNMLFGSYLSGIGRTDEGLALLKKANELSPKKQQILFELGVAYIKKQDATNAIKVIKEAYDLDPTYPEARKMYALLAIMTGQGKLAAELISPIKNDSFYYGDDRFLNIYKETGNQAEIDRINSLRSEKK